MCGRFTLVSSSGVLREEFALGEALDLPPRYNVAPGQAVAAVRGGEGGREMVMFQWGLLPSWAADPRGGNRPINARAETAADKPTFRAAFRSRRCLVLADGFFEWQQGRVKRPFWFRLAGGRPFAIAGLWEEWTRGGESVLSCALLTTDANDLVRPVHDRMPVILSRQDQARWLDPGERDPDRLRALLRPYPAAGMTATPVGSRVNSPRADDPGCVELVAEVRAPRQQDLFGTAG